MTVNVRNIVDWPRPAKYFLLAITDILVVLISIYTATAIQFDQLWPAAALRDSLPFIMLAVVTFPLVFVGFRLYHHMVRYAGSVILFEAVKSVSVAVVLTAVLGWGLLGQVLPLGVLLIFWAYVLLGTASSRLFARWLITSVHGPDAPVREKTAIYGAGGGGLELYEVLINNPSFDVVALFDDDPELAGRRVQNCRIYKAGDLPRLTERMGIRRIILAIPSASHRRRREILAKLEKLGIKVQMLPSVDELIDGKVTLNHVRDVQAADLLWRQRHKPNQRLLEKDVHGKSVMVTGGGGSIGSELCRQAVANGVQRLAIVENSEFALYTIEQELCAVIEQKELDVELVAILGDVCDERSMARQLKRYGIETVYHAAAYKHVPMVEFNPREGVRNNVFGTLALARAATAAGVGKVILVSTDKAVRPANVMGASKRLAEMVLQALQNGSDGGADRGSGGGGTRFTMVRFGNVLDSAGSVVPLFRSQIKAGGPITLTHREVTRFFMTIPEAAQLVLQAGAMSKGGEVFLLEMGEPIRIYDLAKRMVHLSGLSIADGDDPDGDIEIKITGMRPGEKLHEELFIGTNVSGTDHPSILRAEESYPDWNQLSESLNDLGEATEVADADKVREILGKIVEGYEPSATTFVERRKEPRLTIVST